MGMLPSICFLISSRSATSHASLKRSSLTSNSQLELISTISEITSTHSGDSDVVTAGGGAIAAATAGGTTAVT